jgi:hypothetical protein
MCQAESGKPTPPAAGGGAGGCSAAAPCPLRRVVKITAKVPVTLSARGADSIAPPFNEHTFSSTSTAQAFASNVPTVLVRNCKDIELIAETTPPNQADVAWAVVPNPGPGAPVLAAAGFKASLKTDASGGYSISATLDGTTVYWNLVLVEIKVTKSKITRHKKNFKNSSGGGMVGSSSGAFNVNNPAVCAMHARAEIDVTAGGQAALDAYCNKVTVGMVNVLLNDTAKADYHGGGRERERINKTSGLASPVVNPAVTVTDLGYPILDRGGSSATRATGGDTVFLSQTRSTPATGKSRVVETCDSPAVGFDGRLPEFGKAATKKAKAVNGINDFVLHLVAYSTDANYSYVSWGTAPWTANYAGSVSFPGGAPRWTKAAGAGITGAGSTFTLIANGQEAQAAGCEVRPPVFLDYILDAR